LLYPTCVSVRQMHYLSVGWRQLPYRRTERSRKTARIPAVVMRGYYFDHGAGSAQELVRPKARDLFR